MQKTSSKSQIGSGIQLSIPNSPTMSIPMSIGDLQNSSYSRQRKPSIHQINTTKQINSTSPSPFTSSIQQKINVVGQENSQESSLIQNNSSQPLSSGLIQATHLDSNSTGSTQYQQMIKDKSYNSMTGSSLVNSIQQQYSGSGKQMKRLGSTQNSNDGGYAGNILQLGTSFSPLSSTHTSSTSNIQIANLLASSGHSNPITKNINNNILNINSSHSYNQILKQKLSPQSNGYYNQQLSKANFQNSSVEQQNSSNSHQPKKHQQLRKNLSLGNIQTLQRSSGGSTYKKELAQMSQISGTSKSRDHNPLNFQNSFCTPKDKFDLGVHFQKMSSTQSPINFASSQSNQPLQHHSSTSNQQFQDFSQILSDFPCQNSLHLYNKHFQSQEQNNGQTNQNQSSNKIFNNSEYSYEIMQNNNLNTSDHKSKSSSSNLPKQYIQNWVNSHQAFSSRAPTDNNLSSYFNQLSTISGEKPNIQQNEILPNQVNSELKPNNLSFTTSSNQLDIICKEDSSAHSFSIISQNSNNNKASTSHYNQSATTFQESVSDQKLEINQQVIAQVTPFSYTKQDITNPQPREQIMHSQSASCLKSGQTEKQMNSKISYPCKNHRSQNIDESLELNAVKMIGEQKKLQEMSNKKEAVDKLMIATKDLIPQLQNTIQSMDRKESDIYKFLETQERNVDSQFNKLIFELNQNRQAKLNQIYQCKQEIKHNYLQASQSCQQSLQDLIQLHSDIFNNYNSVLLEIEESKVATVIQNYYSIWNEAYTKHEYITKQKQLDVFKADQNQFQQIKDQINFLSTNILKKLQTTCIKLNNNSIFTGLTPKKRSDSVSSVLISPNTRSRSPKQQQQFVPIQTEPQITSKRSNSPNQSQNNSTSTFMLRIPQINQQINPNNTMNYNRALSTITLEDQIEKEISQNPNSVQIQNISNTKQQHTLQERKIKSVQNSINLSSKQIYISFDNKEAFKNHHDATTAIPVENKENIVLVNGKQTVFNAPHLSRIQNVHHAKSSSQPQLIQINLKDVQNIKLSDHKNKQLQTQTETLANNNGKIDEQVPQEDCNTFRNREAYFEIENERKIVNYLDNLINKANQEKQKLFQIQNQSPDQQILFKEVDHDLGKQTGEEITQELNSEKCSSKSTLNPLDIYGSIQRQNKNTVNTEGELESKMEGQTPNFSNKKKGVAYSPNKKNCEFDCFKNTETNVACQEFNYNQENSEEQRALDEIVEKEKKSRDSSINKKKQFNEMIKAVQHNQIQRNLNCETILRRVSENQIDTSSLSSNSTPKHLRSNSGYACNLSDKNSMLSSKNKSVLKSYDQLNSEKHKRTIKKSTLDELLSSKNAITSEEIGKLVQQLSFEKHHNQSISQKQNHNFSIIEEENRISQTIVKPGVDNNYENILDFNQIATNSQVHNNSRDDIINTVNINYQNYNAMLQNNPVVLTEECENMTNPLKTTQNSDQKLNDQIQRVNYYPFSQIIDY